MELTLSMFLIVCPLVFLAGLIDSIAGGGGLISLPAYTFAGIPGTFALGTNKLSSICGTSIASFRYYKNKFVDLTICLPSMGAALLGSFFGTNLALVTDGRYLQRMLLIALPITAFFVFKKKNFDSPENPLSRTRMVVYSILISLVIGIYDGFFGPGSGTFLILLYNGIAKIDPRIASGNAKLVNFSSNFAAVILFFINGNILLPLGLSAAAFNILGAYIGSGLVINKGTKVIRYAILVVLALLFIKVAYDTFFN